MKISPIEHGLQLGVSALPRSPGLHISTIYGALYKALEPTRFTDSPPDLLRFELGFAFEEMLEAGLKTRLVGERPDEQMTEEGIAYSPDLIIFEDDRVIVGELKLTYMSSREVPREDANSFPPKFDRYFTQIKAYCYNIGTLYARLYVLFVCGDYNRPFSPELLCWDITFSQKELDENWLMLMNFARSEGML